MPKKRMLINPATHGPPSFKEPEMEEDSDEIVLGTDDDERDSVCFVEIEERPERSRPAINKATARRTPFSRSASSNTIVLQPSDKEENDTVALEDEDQEEEDDEIILATPSPPGSPLHPIVPLPRPGSSIPKKRRVVASDSEEERDEAVVQHREGLRKKTKQSGTVQVQRPISDHHLPYSDVASSSRTKPSRPTQQRPPSPTTSSTSSAGCYVLIGEESADAISDGEEEQKSKDGNQSRELRNRRVTMLAEDSTTSASRRKQKGKQKEKGGKKNRRGSVGIDVEEDKLALPPQALPVRSPSVAVLTGRSCGPDFKILNIPGQPTLEELKTQQSEQQVVADQLSERLFNADVPWTKSDVVFKDPVRGGRAYNSISIGDQTFSRHDHVHLIIPVKDKEGPNAGPGGMGWFARIEEFYRVLSEKDFPGKMRIRWYYHSKSETASGSFGHDQELYKSDSFDDVHISSLRTKVSVKYFSDGPVDGFDFFCRASLSVGRLETDSKSFTLLNHYSESHQVSTPLKILDVCSGFGGMAQGFVDAGVGEVEWAIESDPIPAATNAINSPNTRVLNLDINDVVAAVASALKEEVEGDDGPPPLISLKDRGLADQLDGRLNDAYTGYYKLSDLPTKSGEVGLAIITLPCQGWSGANSAKNDYDPSKGLIPTTLTMLEIFKPIYIVFENVPKIRSGTLEPPSFRSGLGRPLNLIEAALLRLGYSFVYRVEMATDHGSSQKRERLILCATLRGYPIFEHPSATHSALPPDHKNRPPGLLDAPTIIDTIGDLSAFDLTTNFDDEPASTMKRYASRPMNDEQERLRDGLKEVSLHIPVHYQDLKKNTILDVPLRADASFKDLPKKYLKAMKGEIHPNWYRRLPSTSHFITFTCSLDPLGWGGAILHYGQARTYSIREMARGQGIRDSIEFEGSLREIVSQIGNSVPWQLAYAIAKSLKKTLDREDGEDE